MNTSKEKDTNENKLVKPELPGGFRDALPEDAIAKEAMIETVKRVYERFGFDPMQTSSVERNEVLVGGDNESSKIIFNVSGSKDDIDEIPDISLRFDLTVPLARVIAANPDIPKPFKRYQIGKVWRGERQQAGRYREFIQADIDIIGVKSLDADVEIIQVMYETLKALGVENFSIKLNNKQEAFQLMRDIGIGEERQLATAIAVDKKEKMNSEKWERKVQSASNLSREDTKKYLWKISGENNLETTKIEELRKRAEARSIPQSYLIYDASLMRGLGYYTGSIFEVTLGDLPEFGTVFAGGRYDGLTARFSNQPLPAVGASLGVDRLYAALEKLGEIKKQKTLVQVLVLNLSPNLASDYSQVLQNLRINEISSTLYLGDDAAFQTQLVYAVKKEIPFVIIYGDKEKTEGKLQVKDLRKETQEAVKESEIVEYIKSRLGATK